MHEFMYNLYIMYIVHVYMHSVWSVMAYAVMFLHLSSKIKSKSKVLKNKWPRSILIT